MRDQPVEWRTFVGITVLLLADVVLVSLALAATRAPVPTATARVAVPATLPSPSATPTPTPMPAPAASGVAELTRVLGAAGDSLAYRAATGPCPDVPAQLEVTVDAGATWTPTIPAEARSIQSIAATSSDVSVVALDAESCAPAMHRSFVQGAEWQVADELGSRWHLDDGAVIAPGGAASTPCAASVQVAARSESDAVVLCADGTLAGTSDAGATWSATTVVPAAASVTSGADGYFVAVADRDGCEGAQVVFVSAELQPGPPGACVGSDAAGGATVVSFAGGVLWLWSGDVVARSSDGGATW